MELLFGILLITVLLVLAWIDLRTFLLPDYITIPLIVVGFTANALGWTHWPAFLIPHWGYF